MSADKKLMDRFAGAVRARRRSLGITQEAAAERAGIALNTWSEVERGRQDLRFTTLAKVAQGLGVSAGTLVGDADPPPPIRLERRAVTDGALERAQVWAGAFSHPVRRRIVDHLCDGESDAPSAIAQALGVPLGVTCYHVRRLHALGLIEPIKRVQVRGSVRTYYRLVHRPTALRALEAAEQLTPPASLANEQRRERLGRALRRTREAAGLSPATVAAQLGVSEDTINRIERGELDPSCTMLDRLSVALGSDTPAIVHAAAISS
jgi:transcriptional regulator with XRE-family HTH domain